MLLVAVLLRAACTLKPGHYFYEFSISWQFAAVFLPLSAAGALDDEEFFIIKGSVSISLSDFASLVSCGHTNILP